MNSTKIIKPKPRKSRIPIKKSKKSLRTLEPSFGCGKAPMSRSTRKKFGWEPSTIPPKNIKRIGNIAPLARIVGSDDRERISATDEYPWCLITYLEIQFPEATSIGTGWLIGGNKVLTAGHCVYDERYGGWADAIKVIPGNDTEVPADRSTDDAPYGVYQAVAIQATDEWVASNENRAFDVGVIHIDKPIGDDLGHFGIMVNDESDDKNGKYIRVAGYPKYQYASDGVNPRYVVGQMYSHTDEIIDIKDRQIFYRLDTTGGQSGAPVVLLGADDNDLVAIGIHNYGYEDGKPKQNEASLINWDIWEYIEKWLAADY